MCVSTCVCVSARVCVHSSHHASQLEPQCQLGVGLAVLFLLTRSCCSVWRIQRVSNSINPLSEFLLELGGGSAGWEEEQVLHNLVFCSWVTHSILTFLNIASAQYTCC